MELLELISDPIAQRSYEFDVSIADVPAELVSMWFDDLYHPKMPWFSEAFSDHELTKLASFHNFYSDRLQLIRHVQDLDTL